MSKDDKDDINSSGSSPGFTDRQRPSFDPKKTMSISGYLLVTSAAVIIVILTVLLIRAESVPGLGSDQSALIWTIQHFGFPILMVVGASILGGLGVKLLGAAGKSTPTIIPPEDREMLTPLIESANKEAIKQYVILSSLSGFTGTFQKIGFSGLPLATVLLTLIFAALSFYKIEFLDLTKLTLGAFIGSFVQRGQDAPQLPFSK